MDEADSTEKDRHRHPARNPRPEQNHLFHDKYTLTTVDIDPLELPLRADGKHPSTRSRRRSSTAARSFSWTGTASRKKIAIARDFLLQRIRERYISGRTRYSSTRGGRGDLLRHLITNYTFEAGVRDLETHYRTLYLRVQRKEIMGEEKRSVKANPGQDTEVSRRARQTPPDQR